MLIWTQLLEVSHVYELCDWGSNRNCPGRCVNNVYDLRLFESSMCK